MISLDNLKKYAIERNIMDAPTVDIGITSQEKESEYRLPIKGNATPEHYDLALNLDLAEFTFTGKECVKVNIANATNKLTLNAVELDITSAIFRENGSSPEIKSSSIDYDTKKEWVTLTLPEEIIPGTGYLFLEWNGKIAENLKGLYRFKYSHDGKNVFGAVTQFEESNARRVFPCWDEPAHKATFQTTITAPSELTVISNTPISRSIENIDDNSKTKTVFGVTPKMSTYLLAFVVGRFEYLEQTNKDGVLVRVYTPIGKREWGRFALDFAGYCLEYYTEFFDFQYPLSKMDLIAVQDFSAGAMENWGCVTYRETALLLNPKNELISARQGIALTVAHELAHQWFGNLVTMEWWKHLWLNEGFASWFEYLPIQEKFPEWEMDKQFLFNEYVLALHADGQENTHPIEVETDDPKAISEVFDSISYHKGASILFMLANYLGLDVFKEGLRQYIKLYQYGNASTDDLWECLEKESGKPIVNMMRKITRQSGYPVITASIAGYKKGNITVLNCTQERFIEDGSDDKSNTLWEIPIQIVRENTASHSIGVLTKKHQEFEIRGEYSEWTKLNEGQHGFYRVHYKNKSDWLRLGSAVEKNELSFADKLMLIDDAFALSKADKLQTVVTLELMLAYKDEMSNPLWSTILSGVNRVKHILETDAEATTLLHSYTRSLLETVKNKVGWHENKDDSSNTRLLRSLILSELGRSQCEETIHEARTRFYEEITRGAPIPIDLKTMVYGIVAHTGSEWEYKTLLSKYKKSTDAQEKVRILRTLGYFNDPKITNSLLEFSFNPDNVRTQDFAMPLGGMTNNPTCRALLWEFMKDQWKELDARYGGGHFMMSNMVKIVTQSFHCEDTHNDVKNFFDSRETKGIERSVKQSLEKIKSNIEWEKRDKANIVSWLREYNKQ
jgi:puromycin-sensitive aminopeptidase